MGAQVKTRKPGKHTEYVIQIDDVVQGGVPILLECMITEAVAYTTIVSTGVRIGAMDITRARRGALARYQ